ncbi:GNAT family N-acetyltransferase [Bizionia sp. KMM 8389]
MSHNNIVIREITIADNAQMAAVVRSVFIELNAPKTGTAYEDPCLDTLSETYNKTDSVYFVATKNNRVIGGCGIAALEDSETNICELQKMYFLPEGRGIGLGAKMIKKCLNKARELGFESCYLETLPFMVAAQKLYAKVGFEPLDAAMGKTGHFACNVWMLKQL